MAVLKNNDDCNAGKAVMLVDELLNARLKWKGHV